MHAVRYTIPFYKEINELLASIGLEYTTADPLFYCLRLKENDGSLNNYKPPFRKDFYFITLRDRNMGECPRFVKIGILRF